MVTYIQYDTNLTTFPLGGALPGAKPSCPSGEEAIEMDEPDVVDRNSTPSFKNNEGYADDEPSEQLSEEATRSTKSLISNSSDDPSISEQRPTTAERPPTAAERPPSADQPPSDPPAAGEQETQGL